MTTLTPRDVAHVFEQLRNLRKPAALRAWLAQLAVSLVRRRLRRARLLRFLGLDRSPELIGGPPEFGF